MEPGPVEVNATTADWVLSQVKDVPWLGKAVHDATWPPSDAYLKEFVLPVVAASAALLLIHIVGRMASKKKVYAVPVQTPGPGISYRHQKYLGLLETPFEGAVTVPALFDLAVKKHGSRPLLGTRKLIKKETEKDEKTGRDLEKLTLGEYEFDTYSKVAQRVLAFSRGLKALGHGVGEKVAIFAETRQEWYISLQACLRENFTVVTVYASLGEDALVHSLNETEVTTVICDSKQLSKICKVGANLGTVKRIVYMLEQLEDVKVPSGVPSSWQLEPLSKVEQMGSEANVQETPPSPSDVAVIMYTSGSTGLPKGVMMTHSNLVAIVAGVLAMVPNVDSNDVYIAYLPLAHVLELAAEVGMVAVGASIGYGTPLTLIDSSAKIKKGTKGDAPTLKPTLMAAVPAILDRIRDGVRKQVDAKGGVVKKLFELSYKRCLATVEGKSLGASGAEKALWTALVFKKIRAAIGGRVRIMLSGGAPLSADTQRFMNVCFGMPIGQGYGLTETCAGATFSEVDDRSVGRVGPPIPCCYIKLIDWEEGGYRSTDKPMPRGEICIGGPSVTLGYFKNEKKTAEDYHVDEAGTRWFHSGDIGQMHPDGVLEIVDRKKDIVKLQAGEYVSLGKVEAILQASPYVDNIMMHAEAIQSYAVALVTPNQQALSDWAKGKGIDSTEFEKLCQSKEANAEVKNSLAQVGKSAKLEKFEIPQKITLLPEPWTPENNLVTAALKLKRENIRKTYASELQNLYK